MAASTFSRTAGVLASVMLGAGAIGPLAKSMLVNVQLDDVSEPRAQILLGLAALSLLLSAIGRTGWLTVTSLGAIITLGSLFVSTGDKARIPVVSDVLDQLTSTLSGLVTDFAKNVTSLEWGAGCLLGGIVLLLIVGLLSREF